MMNETNAAPVAKQHVFEHAGLGLAPYKYLGCEVLRGPLTMPDGSQIGSFGQPMGCCQYCSTGIAYLFWLESADGKKFYVGSDCIYKSGDAGLKRIIDPIVAQHNQEIRDSRAKRLLEIFTRVQGERPDFPPAFHATEKHPNYYYASIGRTVGDYNRYVFDHTGFLGRSRMARKYLVDAGVEIPDNKRKKRVVSATAVPKEYHIAGMFGGIKIIDLGD